MSTAPKIQAAFDGSAALQVIQAHWLSNVIHDLSSSLFVAQGYTRMVLGTLDSSVSESQHRYLTLAFENLGQIAATVKALNDFPHRSVLELETVSLRSLIEEAVSQEAGTHPSTRTVLPNSPLSTVGDREKLASAVRSFVRGAVEFTGETGNVEISVHEENEKIVVEMAATRHSGADETFFPEFSEPSRLWRLHGGNVYVSRLSEQSYVLSGELPVVRFDRCREVD